MLLKLSRDWPLEKRTIGRLYLIRESAIGTAEEFVCYVCEDRVRKPGEKKVPGETAIPRGTYPVILSYSPKFRRILPEILKVPDFEGIRIHKGNSEDDTRGCLLVGLERDPQGVYDCDTALDKVIGLLSRAKAKNEAVTLKIA